MPDNDGTLAVVSARYHHNVVLFRTNIQLPSCYSACLYYFHHVLENTRGMIPLAAFHAVGLHRLYKGTCIRIARWSTACDMHLRSTSRRLTVDGSFRDRISLPIRQRDRTSESKRVLVYEMHILFRVMLII